WGPSVISKFSIRSTAHMALLGVGRPSAASPSRPPSPTTWCSPARAAATASPKAPAHRCRPTTRVIGELMGHQAGLRGEREGSMIGTGYRHMTEAMHRRPLHPDRESYPVMFGRVRRAELLRACRANARAPYRRRGAVGTTFVSPRAGKKPA